MENYCDYGFLTCSVGGDVAVYFSSENLAQLALLARFNPDGTLDETYGDEGIEYYAFKYPGDGPVDSYLRFVAVTEDGKIMAGGGSILNTPYAPGRPAVIRVLPNGMYDNSLGGTGVLVLTDSIYWRGFMEKIVINDDNSFYAVSTAVAQFGKNHQILYKINNNGTFDASFGEQGLKVIQDPLANNDWASNSLMIHPSGGLWIIGQNGPGAIWSARCSETTGEPINSYGENGFMHAYPNPLGSISVAAAALHGEVVNVVYTSLGRRIGMTRIEPNGQIDGAFGHSYLELQDASQGFIELSVNDFIQSDEGRFVLVGKGRYPSTAHWETTVVAFKNNPEIISAAEPEPHSPGARLGQVYPNPCRSNCMVSLVLFERSYTRVELFSLSGKSAGDIYSGFLPSGQHLLDLNEGIGRHPFHQGMYFLRVSVTHGNATEAFQRKLVIQ
ncbi:MAG: T9SS type A sorting domain-containing protein [Lewinellaceae bacterium]|nr:T9SS type A sorting domain-containing protein [Lewinellaceae bacterium]